MVYFELYKSYGYNCGLIKAYEGFDLSNITAKGITSLVIATKGI